MRTWSHPAGTVDTGVALGVCVVVVAPGLATFTVALAVGMIGGVGLPVEIAVTLFVFCVAVGRLVCVAVGRLADVVLRFWKLG